MKKLVIIRGVQGSGKTTLASMFVREGFRHFEADMYFMSPEGYKFDGEKIGSAHLWCQAKVKENMEECRDVVVANTFIKKKDIKPYLEMAEKYGYTVQIIICQGRFQNVHGVSEEVVELKRQQFQY